MDDPALQGKQGTAPAEVTLQGCDPQGAAGNQFPPWTHPLCDGAYVLVNTVHVLIPVRWQVTLGFAPGARVAQLGPLRHGRPHLPCVHSGWKTGFWVPRRPGQDRASPCANPVSSREEALALLSARTALHRQTGLLPRLASGTGPCFWVPSYGHSHHHAHPASRQSPGSTVWGREKHTCTHKHTHAHTRKPKYMCVAGSGGLDSKQALLLLTYLIVMDTFPQEILP